MRVGVCRDAHQLYAGAAARVLERAHTPRAARASQDVTACRYMPLHARASQDDGPKKGKGKGKAAAAEAKPKVNKKAAGMQSMMSFFGKK